MSYRIIQQFCLNRQAFKNNRGGFTLIELLVVCVLISIMLAVSVPAVRNRIAFDPLRKAARIIAATIREARLAADGTVGGCFIECDINESRIGLLCPRTLEKEDGSITEKESFHYVELPDGIRFHSIWSGTEWDITSGKVIVWVTNKGMLDQTIINITDDVEEMALISSVFLPEIEFEDRSMSFEDISED